jgi:hypothetical protein
MSIGSQSFHDRPNILRSNTFGGLEERDRRQFLLSLVIVANAGSLCGQILPVPNSEPVNSSFTETRDYVMATYVVPALQYVAKGCRGVELLK